jgi:hypothetical protein
LVEQRIFEPSVSFGGRRKVKPTNVNPVEPVNLQGHRD